MHIMRLARIVIAVAAAIMAIGAFTVSKAEADGFTGVRTYMIWHGGLRLLNSYNCTPTTHRAVLNPIDVVNNKCPTRVWLHGEGLTYCVSPFTSAPFDYEFEASDLQVSANPAPC